MTLIITIFRAIMFNKVTRAIAGVALALLAVFGYVKKAERDAVKQERSDRAAQDAADNLETRERIDNAKPVDTDASSARERMRKRGK